MVQRQGHFGGAATRMDSFEKLIQETFNWSDAEASSNMGMLFPQGLQHSAAAPSLQQQSQQQLTRAGLHDSSHVPHTQPMLAEKHAAAITGCPASNTTPAAAAARPAVVSPFTVPGPMLAPAAADAARCPASSAAASAPPAVSSPGSFSNVASPFAGLTPDLLLMGPASAAAATAAGATEPSKAATTKTAAAATGTAGGRGTAAATNAAAYTLPSENNLHVLLQQQFIMQQAQEALLLRLQQQQQQLESQQQQQQQLEPQQQQQQLEPQQQQQQQAEVVTVQVAPVLQPAQQQQRQQQDSPAGVTVQQQQQQRKGRRGRPPKADGNYSAAYAALKKYRQRKRNEVDEMEAELAAKQAQLLALQQENLALRHKQEALESTIAIQEGMVAQLSALQVGDTAAAAAAGAGSSSSSSKVAGTSSSSSRPAAASVTQQAELSAVIAAFVGEEAAPGNQLTNRADQDTFEPADPNNPDWAGIMAQVPPRPVNNRGVSAGFHVEELDVPVLLDRYKGYVAQAAAALQQLAAVLQQQQPQQFPPDQPVPPAALGVMTSEQAAGLGVFIPHPPFTLAEFLALGNDERLPPALPAINLLNGKHESIEPQIWRVVASQLTLQPGQAEKLAAAWQLYNSSLDRVNEERARLMRRLQDALDTCHRSTAAAAAAGVGLSEGGVRLGVELANPNDAAFMISDEKLLADVLNQHEYYDLSEAIDENLAREDQIMILFDYALCMMMDKLQLAQIVVSSWPFFPHMGAICTWIVDAAAAAGSTCVLNS